MELKDVLPNPGSKIRKRRVGRGDSSGRGEKCGKGGNGQKARRGVAIGLTFEGGQSPFTRRIPKRGFSNVNFNEEYSIINLSTLEYFFNNEDEVSLDILNVRKIIKNRNNKLKVLGDGELTKALHVTANKFSANAVKAIEACGGSVEVL